MTSPQTQEGSDGLELDPKVLYTLRIGLQHGRLTIGNGDVSKAIVIAAGKEMTHKPFSQSSNQSLRNANSQLTQQNAQLNRRVESSERLIKVTT